MPIEAIVFDMDGLLIDSEPFWLQARQEFAQELGKVWTDDDQIYTMGVNTYEWAEIMKERLELTLSLDAIVADIIGRIKAYYAQNLPLMPYAVESVRLAAEHFRVALASGSATELINHVLRLTQLEDVFEVVVYGDDIPVGKPAPDIYLEALRQLNLTPEQAAGVEDSGNGVRSVHAAGMVTIAVPNPKFPLSNEVLQQADFVLDSLHDFDPVILK